jgi:hypothetical protein
MRLHLFTFFGFAALALTLGLLPGCAGGQTGDLSGQKGTGHETGSSGSCVEHKQKLAGFDEMTDLGTAEQVLAFAEKSFDAPITWKVAGAGQSWTVGPESGKGALHIDVARGQSAYLLTYTAKQSESGETIGILCPPPQLGVEAHVNLTTDGGALAESYDTLLHTSTPGVATLSVPLDLTKLSGALAVSLSDPHAKLVQTSLEATLMAEGTTGRISGIEQVDSGSGPDSVSSARGAVLAVWPASAACAALYRDGEGLGVPIGQQVLGVTGQKTLASVTPPAPVDIAWLSGATTKLGFGIVSTGDGCFNVRGDVPVEIGGGPTASYPVTISLKSADGRLDGAYVGQVVVTGSGNERRATASATLQLSVDELSKSGFSSVNVPADSDGLMLLVDSQLVHGSASGSVRLVSVSNPPCLTEPQKPMSTPGSGASAGSNGCAGQSQTQLETASWTN